MPQISHIFAPLSTKLSNDHLIIQNTETTVLRDGVIGFQNFTLSITVINGNSVSANIYGSADNLNFYLIKSNALVVTSGATGSYTLAATPIHFISVTITSVSQSTVNCQLIGEA